MTKKLVQTEDSRFLRDTSSLGLINNDRAAYAQYKMQRQRGNQVETLSAEVSSLKQDMIEIKTMLVSMMKGNIDGK